MKAAEAKLRLNHQGGGAVLIIDRSNDLAASRGEQCAIYIHDPQSGVGDYITSQRGADVKLRTIQAAYSFIRRELGWTGSVSIQSEV